jgi:hypothetical protein
MLDRRLLLRLFHNLSHDVDSRMRMTADGLLETSLSLGGLAKLSSQAKKAAQSKEPLAGAGAGAAPAAAAAGAGASAAAASAGKEDAGGDDSEAEEGADVLVCGPCRVWVWPIPGRPPPPPPPP